MTINKYNYDPIMQYNPEVVMTYNQATKYLTAGNFKKAAALYKKALALFEFKEAYCNLGNCCRALGLDKEMFKYYTLAISDNIPYLQPPANIAEDACQHALNNLGLAHYMYGRDDEAIKLYERAIRSDPKFWSAWWNCSTAYLRKASTSGDPTLFAQGWEMYNARFLKPDALKLKNKQEDLRFWEPHEHVPRLVILAEQGIGDNIMFGRYLSEMRKYCDELYVQCDAGMEDIFSEYNCIRDASEVNATAAYPMCSLGRVMSDIPAGDWLKDKFNARVFPTGFNVGIVWAGSATHSNNTYRSVPIHRFHRLAKYCNLYSLDPTFKGNKYVTPLGNKTWTDTAECINGLDLVIGVDTSVMHMCGSLGHRGWLLQPYKETDFRWGNGVRKSVWYSDIEIYENPQSWEYVFDCVERDLKELVYA